ncbi:MAG: DUF5615 family PIN-like protein [Paludibacter sp.]|jgi:predicted nuclease of predicted toxin-antitoxin system|nr:DUF5615 family PIN-like protein [Paludibacter sp.]
MKLKFIVDTQLPPSLAEFLRRRNLDAKHTIDYPNGAFTTDSEIRKIAITEHRIIITKDNDFFDYYLLRGFPPAVLFLQFGNCKNSELFDFIEINLPKIISLFTEDEKRLIFVQQKKLIFF